MKKKRWAIALGAVMTALIVLWPWPRQPNPQIGLGPHRTRIRWVTYDQAHPRPVVKFTWPWGTPFAYPRPAIPSGDADLAYVRTYPLGGSSIHIDVPYASSLVQPDDPAIVAGYLLVDTDCATLYRDTDTEVFGGPVGTCPAVVRVCYATSPQTRRAVLEAGFMEGEKIEVVLPYDPSKIAARVKPSRAKAGPFTLKFQFDTDRSGSNLYLRMDAVGAKNTDDFQVSYKNGSTRGSCPLSVPAVRVPSGDYKFEGTICPVRPPYYWPNPTRTFPISVVVRVDPLAKSG